MLKVIEIHPVWHNS